MDKWVDLACDGRIVIMWRVQASLSCLGLYGVAPLANDALLSLADMFSFQVGEMQVRHPQLCHRSYLNVYTHMSLPPKCMSNSNVSWHLITYAFQIQLWNENSCTLQSLTKWGNSLFNQKCLWRWKCHNKTHTLALPTIIEDTLFHWYSC